ncbi:porin [uncultured Methylobacterium sp.]|uniref:porin n=1 Tax=uncultured Methylobacterium sp. TaxID=157278 RepID=UPI0035CBDA13
MKLLKSSLLASAAGLAAVAGAQAADLPVKKAAPIEYVRICSAYGAGFFYIPGTDTCLRVSGRARLELGYQPTYSRQNGSGYGDTTGYQGRMRINLDARTQTAYGTLRAFVRLDAGSRSGYGGMNSGTQQRIAQAYPALGVDGFGRLQQFSNVDKAFVQFAGFTAGRASSFFDFYAHDFEFIAATAGSDVSSTNLAAYTATIGNGFSATISMEDPSFRRTPVFSPTANPSAAVVNSNLANFGLSNSPVPVFIGYNAAGVPTRYSFVDAIERNRLPDFVGVLRYDAPWGSAQLSAAVHESNVGNVANGAGTGAGTNVGIAHTSSEYGYAVQGGVKVNLPFIAPGDTLYLQGAYAVGAQSYTGYSNYSGSYAQSAITIQGQGFSQYFSDAVINPFTGQMSLSETFAVVGSYLHYWSPEFRSAFFGSYGEQSFGAGVRAGQGNAFTVTGLGGSNAVGTPGTRFFALSQAIRDTYQIVAGASLIWSPVKDLDIGLEGMYTQIGVSNGRVINVDKDPTAYSAARIASINAGGFVRTQASDEVFQVRARVQRDF